MTPGTVVTARLSGGVGAEKDKIRPVLVVHDTGATVLVLAITDAHKKRIPTHALIQGYTSGTQVKDALVTCEHAWFLDPGRLEPRQGARALTDDELGSVGRCLRIALGMRPIRPPPGRPDVPRGSIVQVDFAGGVGLELSTPHRALVLSNDAGNYFGRTLLVAPFVDTAIVGVPLSEGTLDLGRLRIVDVDRLRSGILGTTEPGALQQVEATLEGLLPAASEPTRRRRRRRTRASA